MRERDLRSLVTGELKKNRLAMFSFIFVAALFIIAIFAPVIAGDRPILMRYNGKFYAPAMTGVLTFDGASLADIKRTKPKDLWMIMPPIPYGPGSYDLDAVLKSPSSKHLLGTDGDGRDVASLIVHGSRISISVGIVAVGLAVIIGVILGAIAGYLGGWTDILISRLIEVMICFPTFFLILALLAFVGPSIYNIMIAIGITGWTGIARLVRGECLKLKGMEFVSAARAAGCTRMRIMFRHLLPQAMAPVLVSASFGVAGAILAESALSFLGFGVPPATPSWGSLLSQAQMFMDIAWWLTLAPGFAIFLTITSYNIVGEAIRDAIDPKA